MTLDREDVTVDVYRGAGVAVRATHRPTGATVTVDEFRSEWQNKEKALADLEALVVSVSPG